MGNSKESPITLHLGQGQLAQMGEPLLINPAIQVQFPAEEIFSCALAGKITTPANGMPSTGNKEKVDFILSI